MKRGYSLYVLRSQHKQLSKELKVAIKGEKQYIGSSKIFWKKMVKQLTPIVKDLENSIKILQDA